MGSNRLIGKWYHQLFLSGLTVLAAFVLALLVLVESGGAQPAAAGQVGNLSAPLVTPTPCEGNYTWYQVSSPNPENQNYLKGIGVVSTNDVWAVGFTFSPERMLITHWDGQAWSVIPAPSTGNSSERLNAVTVVSANDIWAVGYYFDDAIYKPRPLTVHYDGTQWDIVPVNIDFGVDHVFLHGVASAGGNEVIAVGRRAYNVQSPVTLHWNGTEWREEVSGRIPGCPGVPYTCSFYGVTAVGPNDFWAVGAIHQNGPRTLTAHWNGTQWTQVATPNVGIGTNVLRAAANAGAGDIWAVGYYLNYGTGRFATLTMRWNGAQWVIVASPNPQLASAARGKRDLPREPEVDPLGGGGPPPPETPGNMLFGMSAASSNEVWAVGSSDQLGDTQTNTLIMRWDGTQWSVVPSASPSALGGWNTLYDVDATVAGDAWAVGTYFESPNLYRSLIERYNAQYCPSPTPVPSTPTPTPCVGNLGWDVIPSADGSSVTNELKAIGVVAPNDIWAVGKCNSCGGNGLLEHWNGNTWAIVPNGIFTSGFEDIAVVSANDIWVVGNGGGNPNSAVTVHWDGSSWTRIGLGIYGSGDTLLSVEAVSSNDVWAVGYNDDGVLIFHWNGTGWSRGGFSRAVQEQLKGGSLAPAYSLTRLTDLAVISQNDVWAVGTIRVSGSNRTLTMHYDGTSWNIVGSPSPGTYSNILESVAAVSANDVWAVGYFANAYSDAPSFTLTLHWNGTQWSVVSSPNPTGPAGGKLGSSEPNNNSEILGHKLYSVAAASANEVWAVGKYSPTNYWNSTTAIVLRWDGSQWQPVTGPNPENHNQLLDVSVIAPNYAWAVGRRGFSNTYTLTARYGPPCNATPLPTNTSAPTNTPRPPTNTPVQATSTPPRPTATPFPCGVTPLLTESFEHGGTLGPQFASSVATCVPGNCGWRTDADEAFTGAYSAFAPAVSEVSDQRLTNTSPISIPAGTSQATLQFQHLLEFIASDGGVLETSIDGGATWQDAGPNITQGGYTGTINGSFNPLDGREGWNINTFGVWNQVTVNLVPYAGHDLLFRFRLGTDNSIGTRGWNIDDVVVTIMGTCPTGTPNTSTPTNTFVPATTTPLNTSTAVPSATSTSILPTVTLTLPVPTEVPCNISYSDVPSTNTFYQNIMCLSCLGMIRGYPDGTFRPEALITRGQLSKIVANTAGFSEPHSEQTFADVAAGSTFHSYIERLASRLIISGYACGGPDEPCDAANRPYFRSSANATRGQISKIVASAANMGDPIGPQMFEDVPSTYTFYLWVQRLAQHNVMGGYSCGGPGEPCDAANRPYFRPAANATRGQVAKITGNSFYPDCRIAIR